MATATQRSKRLVRRVTRSRVFSAVNDLPFAVEDLTSGRWNGEDLLPPLRLMRDGPRGRGAFVEGGREIVPFYRDVLGVGPDTRLLEIGSGIGRRAVPLIDRIDGAGSYVGVEADPRMVRWCIEHITPRNPAFTFMPSGVRNSSYGRSDRLPPEQLVFPFPDRSFDVVVLWAVCTHMLPEAIEQHLREVRRMLRPGGRMAASFFVVDDWVLAQVGSGDTTYPVNHLMDGYWTSNPAAPEDLVAVERDWLRSALDRSGLTVRSWRPGSWSNHAVDPAYAGLNVQDIVVATRASDHADRDRRHRAAQPRPDDALPTCSVIIPTYNRSAVMERTLRHLLDQDLDPQRYEILVCDNSTDDTPAVVRRLAAGAATPVRLLMSDERLPAVKRNQGLRAATGDYVVFMNDDVWVRPDFLSEHLWTHRAHPYPVAVLGKVVQSEEMEQTPFAQWYRPFAYELVEDRADQPVPYQFSWSMNLSLPRQVLLDRQLVFHEDWREIGHEDVELGYRWTMAGYRIIYDPRAVGQHYHPHDLNSACRLQESIGRGLRDLEALIPDPTLLERYGVLSWRNSPGKVVRGAVRAALFNRLTVPPLQARLARLEQRSRTAEWCYWKVMLHHTDRGYRTTPPGTTRPVPTLPERHGAGPSPQGAVPVARMGQ